MLRVPLPLLFIAAITTVVVACKKEPLREPPNQLGAAKHGERASGNDCAKKVKQECGMLTFANHTDFQQVYNCLEAAYEAHLDAFETQYGYLSEDDYNDMADQLGFVDEQPPIDFEGALGFTTYRSLQAGAEDAWLSAGGDPGSGPFATNLFDDEIMETLMNEKGAVMIGGVVYLTLEDGSVLEFCSCTLYEQYLQDPSSVNPNDPCITYNKTLYVGNGTCCKSYQKEKGGAQYDSGSKKITWTLLFEYNQFWDNGRAFAKIRHWRYRNGTWRPRRADLLARAYGIYSHTDCKEGGPYSVTKAKKRKTLTAAYWHPIPASIITFKSGEARGYWEYPQGNSLSHSLQFPC